MRYKERIIEHNLHKPREYHTDTLKLQEVDFDSSVISHHPKSFEYYFTHGLVVNDRRYIVKEFFVKHGKLYAILTEDEDTYYEMYLSFLDENVIEDLKKDISDLKSKDKQFDKRLSDLENVRKQNQTLSINDRTISISGGNSIELPADKDTIYDDTDLKQRVKTLEDKPDKDDQTLSINGHTLSISNGNSIELPASVEPKEYRASGNGLLLDADGTFHIEMATDTAKQVPYNTKNGGFFQKLTPDNREVFKPSFNYDSLDNQFYFVANDGTVRRNAILEAGLLLDYEGSYDYGEFNLHKSFSSESVNLSVLSTSAAGISGCASFIQPQELKLEVGILAMWDSNGKVFFRFTPKIVWTIINESTTEHYTHFITKEELDSEEPIEIEVKKNEEVVGRLNMTIKNAKFFMHSVQGTVVLKNPTDNKYYYLPRLN